MIESHSNSYEMKGIFPFSYLTPRWKVVKNSFFFMSLLEDSLVLLCLYIAHQKPITVVIKTRMWESDLMEKTCENNIWRSNEKSMKTPILHSNFFLFWCSTIRFSGRFFVYLIFTARKFRRMLGNFRLHEIIALPYSSLNSNAKSK